MKTSRIFYVFLIIFLIFILIFSCQDKDNPTQPIIEKEKIFLSISRVYGKPYDVIDVWLNTILVNEDSAEIFFNDIKIVPRNSSSIGGKTLFEIIIPDSLDRKNLISLSYYNHIYTCDIQFSFYNPEKLEFTYFSPSKGKSGDTVYIMGKHFHPIKNGNHVHFGNIEAKIDTVVFNETEEYIKVIVPEKAYSAKLKLTVEGNPLLSDKEYIITNENNTDSNSSHQVIIYDFEPTSGIPGTKINIIGKFFHSEINSNKVFINNTKAEVISSFPPNNPTLLTVIVPEEATTGIIKVRVGEYEDETLENFIVYKDFPKHEILDFEPKYGSIGSEVVINGLGFGNDHKAVRVFFGEQEAEIISLSDKIIGCLVPCYADTSKITVMVNEIPVLSEEIFTPARYYSIKFELGNIDLGFPYKIGETKLIPNTEISQISTEDCYTRFVFAPYIVQIDFYNNRVHKLDFISQFNDQRVTMAFGNLPFTSDYNGNISVNIIGSDIEKYLTNYLYEVFVDEPNDGLGGIWYKVLYKVKYYFDNSYLRITIKKCK